MQKWEYFVDEDSTRTEPSVVEQYMDQWGLEGWELVSCYLQDGEVVKVYKRPLPFVAEDKE